VKITKPKTMMIIQLRNHSEFLHIQCYRSLDFKEYCPYKTYTLSLRLFIERVSVWVLRVPLLYFSVVH